MSPEVVCPHCGVRIALEEGAGPAPAPRRDARRAAGPVLPTTMLEDELGFVATPAGGPDAGQEPSPGPLADLRTSTPGDPRGVAGSPEADPLATPDPDDPAGATPGSSSPSPRGREPKSPTSGDAIARLNLELSELPSRPEPIREGDLDGFPVDLSTGGSTAPARWVEPHPGGREGAAMPPAVSVAPEVPLGRPAPGGGLGRVLLLSYASAMTIACLWLVWKLRSRIEPEPARPAPLRAVGRLDPSASRSERADTAPRVPKIASDQVTTLGVPLRVGSLELLPMEVTSTSVTLERTGSEGQRETREGGGGILVLTVRLRNTSDDQAFAPLDPSLLRTTGGTLPESFIEAGESRIYAYPLPAGGEWSIEGQEFQELGPGETLETLVASDAGAVARCSDTMTWRLPLRTGPGEWDVEVLGVRFDRDQIH